MEVLLVSNTEPLFIESFKGPYEVHFKENLFDDIASFYNQNAILIIDKNISQLYENSFSQSKISLTKALIIDATEEAKTFEKISQYIEFFIEQKIRRNQTIVAIGGGVIQDIACFISSIYLRGINWVFFPTTLLAQADSCIGSKSSINFKTSKNILGTFNPPKSIYISTKFLDTLNHNEILSGIGEIIKIYGIYGPSEFKDFAKDYNNLFTKKELLIKHIYKALALKKKIIEADEFDCSTRLVMNYGHSFGHAIESATNYAIPHGIAVSMGCHFANYIAWKLNINNGLVYEDMGTVLTQNFEKFKGSTFDEEIFFSSLLKDKKNQSPNELVLILPNQTHIPQATKIQKNEIFTSHCQHFLHEVLNFKHQQ